MTTFLIFFLGLLAQAHGQDKDQDNQDIRTQELYHNFFKQKSVFEKNEEAYTMYKRARRKDITAGVLGVTSALGLGAAAYSVTQYEDNGQSVDVVQTLVTLGILSLSSIIGTTAILFRRGSNANKEKAIDFLGNHHMDQQSSSDDLSYINRGEGVKLIWMGTENGLGLVLKF